MKKLGGAKPPSMARTMETSNDLFFQYIVSHVF
jgi:hypothetical protein